MKILDANINYVMQITNLNPKISHILSLIQLNISNSYLQLNSPNPTLLMEIVLATDNIQNSFWIDFHHKVWVCVCGYLGTIYNLLSNSIVKCFVTEFSWINKIILNYINNNRCQKRQIKRIRSIYDWKLYKNCIA